MSTFGSILSIARTAIAAHQAAVQVVSQNIANADTPGYAAKDLPEFARVLSRTTVPQPVRTDPRHLPGTQGPDPRARAVRLAPERTPADNAVQIERELMKVSDTETQHSLALGIYRKYMSLFRTALGRQG